MAKRIIVADDSTTVQRVIKLILAPKGYEIESCDSGKKAIQAIRSGVPDIIFADAVMRNINGLELSSELKKQMPELANIPVVIMVNSFDDIKDEDVRNSGAVAKLMKPFDDAALIDIVEKFSKKQEETPEKPGWDMESFARPEVPDLDDPMKTLKNYDPDLDTSEPKEELPEIKDDDFFVLSEDELIKELGVPEPSEYQEVRNKGVVARSEETLSEEEARRMLEEFKLKENFDGTIKFDEDKTPVQDLGVQAGIDAGLWKAGAYKEEELNEQAKIDTGTFKFDDLSDIPSLEKELTTPSYNAALSGQELERLTRESIERVVKQLLPELAEKIIREEIAKLTGKE